MMKRILLSILMFAVPLSVSAGDHQVLEIGVAGMSCKVCAYNVEKSLKRIDGVAQVKVSLDEGRAHILMEPGQAVDVEKVRSAIDAASFTPGDVQSNPTAK